MKPWPLENELTALLDRKYELDGKLAQVESRILGMESSYFREFAQDLLTEETGGCLLIDYGPMLRRLDELPSGSPSSSPELRRKDGRRQSKQQRVSSPRVESASAQLPDGSLKASSEDPWAEYRWFSSSSLTSQRVGVPLHSPKMCLMLYLGCRFHTGTSVTSTAICSAVHDHLLGHIAHRLSALLWQTHVSSC